LRVTIYDASGKTIARPVTWRSSDPRIASVDARGQVTAAAEGWAIVTAHCDGIETHTEVLVRQAVVPLSASGRRESRRLALRWIIVLAVVAGAIVLGWTLLRR
jgi:hypothetical protein